MTIEEAACAEARFQLARIVELLLKRSYREAVWAVCLLLVAILQADSAAREAERGE